MEIAERLPAKTRRWIEQSVVHHMSEFATWDAQTVSNPGHPARHEFTPLIGFKVG